jgi:hypothetical protein
MRKSTKYYMVHLIQPDGRSTPEAIWNGVRDYENHPPNKLIINEPRFACRMKTYIIQVKQLGQMTALMQAVPPEAAVVIWARDRATYDAIVSHCRTNAAAWVQ